VGIAVSKAMLCNWMVTLGVVMALTSQSTAGKIAAMWLPILTFFAQGFEHSVVNMFVIPAGMLLGARISLADWWVWNQIPVTLGNLLAGMVFTGFALYVTHRKRPVRTTDALVMPLSAEAGG
jgi:formate transporter